jgi:hypothetical protein
MGIFAQRRWREKQGAAPPRAPTPPALPPTLTRAEHERAIVEITKSYEIRLSRAGLSTDEREELEQLRQDLEFAKTEWQPMLDEIERVRGELAKAQELAGEVELLTTELEQARAYVRDLEERGDGAEGGTAGGEQPTTEPTGDAAAASPEAWAAETPPAEAAALEAGTSGPEPSKSEEPKPEEPKGKGGKRK